ncbi:MAG TPA: heme-binding domain-containing protein [Planctomycetota bacterium]|nr:heme-binding domain-containing protein [Planctomycetota bacterium]
MRQLFRWKVQRWVLLAIALILGALQFVPVDRSNPPVTAEIPASPEARAVLRRACYDCHSNETVWPWYSRVAPVSWLVARDVHEGREEVNFSTWDRYTTKEAVKKLKESWEEVAEGEMPPWFYVPVHRDSVLSAEDRAVLRNWSLGTP